MVKTGSQHPPRPPLGDRLEQYLTAHGVTQGRYREVKEKFGLPPTCGCDKRKEWLNKVGAWLGL